MAKTASHITPPPPPEKLSEGQIEDALKTLPDWSEVGGVIQRTYAFKNFIASMDFVNAVARAAESAQHHPDILIRWNKVTCTLSTHDAKGVTAKDFDSAKAYDDMYGGG